MTDQIDPTLLLPIDETNPLIIHARVELGRMGADDATVGCYLQALQGFANLQLGPIDIEQLTTLLKMQNVMALTDDPSEWDQIAPIIWQNNRNLKAFSLDGGKNYYILDGDSQKSFQTVPAPVITPPVTPPVTS